MLGAGDLAFVALSMNPLGGLYASIPLAVFKLHYPAWLAVALGVPLTYLQVVVIDLAWTQLYRWDRFRLRLEKKRSPRIERLMASRGAFWSTMVLAPLIGPWVVMAFMRYAQVPQRRVALPILLGILCMATVVAVACVFIPRLFIR